MFDTAAARRMMVDGQVRTADVTNPELIQAMLDVPRELFVPKPLADRAYELTLPDGRVVEGKTAEDGFIRVRSGAEGELKLRLPEDGAGEKGK